MSGSVYKIIEMVGTSSSSWEQAVANAVKRAKKSLCDLRVGEIQKLDMVVKGGTVELFRARIKVSFKYEKSIFVRSRGLPPGIYPIFKDKQE